MTMSKIDTMIYADEHGICSVFTFNPKIESQLNELALKNPERCQPQHCNTAIGKMYRVNNLETVFLIKSMQ